MGTKPASNYLQQDNGEGQIADDMLELWKKNYDNYAVSARTEYYAKHDDEGNTASPKSGDYGGPASALNYMILPYRFLGITEQLVPFSQITDGGLLGRTWINTLSDKKSELSNKLSVAALLEVQEHELEHQIHPDYDELTNRKCVQGRLLTIQGHTGIYHSDRIV